MAVTFSRLSGNRGQQLHRAESERTCLLLTLAQTPATTRGRLDEDEARGSRRGPELVFSLLPEHKTVHAADLKGPTSRDKWQAWAATDKVLFLLCTVYDILSSVYSSFRASAKSSCSCAAAAQPAYIMSPFSDRFIDFALPSAPSLKLFNTRTNWDRYFPTAPNRSLANWKRWTLSLTDLYKRLGEMERGETSTVRAIQQVWAFCSVFWW